MTWEQAKRRACAQSCHATLTVATVNLLSCGPSLLSISLSWAAVTSIAQS